MKEKHPRGSEWRKWDLHVHTPSSYDYKNKSVTNEDFIKGFKSKGISVVAITDHHVIDVERIKELQVLGNKEEITILPGIEFLSDSRGSDPIHFIGIFSENCKINYVWEQIKNNTKIKDIYGKNAKANEIYCNLDDTIKLIKELGGVCTIHAGQKHASIEAITNALPHNMAQKKDIANTVDVYELGKKNDQIGYIENVFPSIGKRLPMILCSDNHNINNYVLKDYCWIKADPTFDGLKQVLNEPEERIFIGQEPPIFQKIKDNRTKYIKNLSIKQIDGCDEKQGGWFEDVTIPLNNEMVAIIGNKGSGKSALADIISLCGFTRNYKDFSFLNKEKFLKNPISKNFEGELTWEDDNFNKKILSEIENITDIERVKYIPQGYFEKLTNEIEDIKELQREIEGVVFAHLNDDDKIDFQTFGELIEDRKKNVETEIKSLINSLNKLNKEIVKLENKQNPKYKIEVEKKLKLKEIELKAITEPALVANPSEDEDISHEHKSKLLNIENINNSIMKLEKEKKDKEKEKKDLSKEFKELNDLKKSIKIKISDIDQFKNQHQPVVDKYELDFNVLLNLTSNLDSLIEVIEEKKSRLQTTKEVLGDVESSDPNFVSLNKKLGDLDLALKEKQNHLNEPMQKYQVYLQEKKDWDNKRNKIIGSETEIDTIKFYKKELEYLKDSLKIEIEQKRKSRIKISEKIYEKKQNVIKIYKNIKAKLDGIISSNAEVLNIYRVNIDARLEPNKNFKDDFLKNINQNVVGTFYSKVGGDKQFSKIIENINFDKKEETMCLLNNFTEAIFNDKRDGLNDAKRYLEDQVKDPEELYNFLFSLSFLDYNYQLTQNKKTLLELSPGERGALLLTFYLLLDKDNKPLIIDQPEDNLDNQSVATILVPFIRMAKKKRQIIMVTHNPNLAVVADAEQIIHVNIDKEKNNTFECVSGSIENREINEKIVQVLEGTLPAFNKRKDKYYKEP